ncbi:four-carbon acid sugar kinase family protein [Erwiniaceae bacterium BAC15a-03b]|uniref:Four-carbon acid sugar kinase family protein n=1 Tax=Winslowiella arboricola TaxID=2978220 RepID=A0A9J6PKZ5_9GAMM|nr:four-carbon acid sugar kinase family protein [Winslowiella arboricola]MCU5771159.1 four-carbon acid sugar kinase family protein [Winslowiella arboricola]MCU5776360.1 four-carbon acid sugar kinase family protein [Winslowiella arboricola]
MTQWKTPVWVIADDFTGANDAGSGLARAGARVNVLFDSSSALNSAEADVWVISTDSRALSAPQAAERTRQAMTAGVEIVRHGWIFKKIDSTLRGNPGAEIAAALLASGRQLALVVPAVPKLGRTTRDGHCLIDGQLLTATEFASDPKTPVSDSSVLARLQAQSDLSGAVLSLEELRSDALAQRLQQHLHQGTRLLVADAESDHDIQRLMRAAAQLEEKPLLAGSAGLSDALGALLADRPAAPLLAVVGSMSDIAQQQIARLQVQHRLTLVDIDIAGLFQQPPWPQSSSWLQQAVTALQQGEHCIIRTCQQAGQRHAIAALCQQHQISRQQLGEQICQQLGELTAAILPQTEPAGLYLSGGDVALAIARRLGASGFQIKGQVAGCVPYGHLLNAYQHMLVMTKAGGFGDENTLVEVIRFIEEKSSE